MKKPSAWTTTPSFHHIHFLLFSCYLNLHVLNLKKMYWLHITIFWFIKTKYFIFKYLSWIIKIYINYMLSKNKLYRKLFWGNLIRKTLIEMPRWVPKFMWHDIFGRLPIGVSMVPKGCQKKLQIFDTLWNPL